MINSTHKIKNLDNSRSLFIQEFSNSKKNTPSSFVFFVTHGLGEHSGCYRHLADFLCSQYPNIKVIAWDMTGHGLSSGKRGYAGHIHWFKQDFMDVFSARVKKSTPVFLFAHSLGGLIQLHLEQENSFSDFNLKGALYSNPCCQLNFSPPQWKQLGAKLLAQSAPWVTLGNEIHPEDLSSDAAYLTEHEKDSLRHKKISPRLYLGMLDLIYSLNIRKKNTNPPSLALLSENDPVCSSKAGNFILRKSGEVHFFKKSKHEILNDKEKESAFLKIKDFINEHI